MTKISGSTTFSKKVFPALWFGMLGIVAVSALALGAAERSFEFVVAPLVMAAFGYVVFRKLVWDLADEVYDSGDVLIFHKGGKEQRVALRDIININYEHMSAPERVVVYVRNSGPLGRELAFSLPPRINPFAKNPLVQQLIERVDHARNN